MGTGAPSVGEQAAVGEAVWDCHVHCYPAGVIADPQDWARRRGEPHWARLVREGPQGWATPEDLLRAMDRDGVEKALLLAWYWENPDTAREQNEWHAQWLARYPGRLLAAAAVHPGLPDPVAALEQARRWGACAAGEILPQVQAAPGWGHPAWADILGWTTAAGWPVTLHLTEPAGHAYPGRVETPLNEALAVFERFPQQRFIAAHWGGGLPFYSLNRRVRGALRHVWFDTAASPLLYDRRVWRTVCDLVGAERLLFGSDFPLLLHPARERAPGWGRLLEEFRSSGLSAAERAAIGAGNAARLLQAADPM